MRDLPDRLRCRGGDGRKSVLRPQRFRPGWRPQHLRSAATELSAGNFSDSIRESIHAVESVARTLEPSGDFSNALVKLEQKTNIHPAMKKGFLALYGFSSDGQGIRHPLLEKEAPSVDEADAMFMIGACSAFVSYLINKARAAGLLT